MTAVFAKSSTVASPGFFEAEARGLAWLAEPAAVPVPRVLSVSPAGITMERIALGAPGPAGAEAFGRGLATLHRAGSEPWTPGGVGFGAPWPGFIGPLPMENGDDQDWPSFYAGRRVQPFLRAARDRDAIDGAGARAIESVCDRISDLAGPAEPPSRLHGDLWSGNVVWDRDGTAWLVDPAAHGGHRETDLAMLALFGFPLLGRTLEAYDEAVPLADGWRARVPLHQLHPLLVHAVLFGSGYGAQAVQAAGAALRA